MGLFDIFKNKSDSKKDNADKVDSAEETVKIAQSLVGAYKELDNSGVFKVSIKEIESFDGAVKELTPTFKSIAELAFDKKTNVYTLIDKATGGNWGNIINSKPFEAAKQTDLGSMDISAGLGMAKTIKAVNPYVLMIAALLVSIEQEVVSIKETGDKILSFLQNDKAATVEGDLKTLNDILCGFKFNWESEEYRTSHHKLALDIKRTSEQNILFYKKQIGDIVEKKGNKLLNSAVNKETDELIGYLSYCRMSIYEYALSSFVELLLLGSFSKGYIDMIKDNIKSNVEEYYSLLEASEKTAQEHLQSSVEAKTRKGIGSTLNAVSSLFSKKKESTGENTTDEIDPSSSQEANSKFDAVREIDCSSIVNNIDTAEKLFNNINEICFDAENIYFL